MILLYLLTYGIVFKIQLIYVIFYKLSTLTATILFYLNEPRLVMAVQNPTKETCPLLAGKIKFNPEQSKNYTHMKDIFKGISLTK